MQRAVVVATCMVVIMVAMIMLAMVMPAMIVVMIVARVRQMPGSGVPRAVRMPVQVAIVPLAIACRGSAVSVALTVGVTRCRHGARA